MYDYYIYTHPGGEVESKGEGEREGKGEGEGQGDSEGERESEDEGDGEGEGEGEVEVGVRMHQYAFTCIRHASACTHMPPYASERQYSTHVFAVATKKKPQRK